MAYKIKRGTVNKPSLRNRYKNSAYELVKGVLTGRSHFNHIVGKMGQNYIIKNHKVFKGFAILGANKAANSSVTLYLIGTSAESGKGYGSALMKRISNNAASRGINVVIIHNPVSGAKNFYYKHGAVSASKENSNNTSLMYIATAKNNSPSPTSRRQPTPNRQISPSRPSPTRRASSSRSSPRQSATRRTPRP